MARRNRVCPADVTQHVVQRGNDRQICFRDAHDFAAYAHWLREAAVELDVGVHSWVFMGNHVHLLVTPARSGCVSRMMQQLGRCYVRYFNHRHERSGTLWEGRFRSCLVDDERYLLRCYCYIELNPVRAGIVEHPSEYPWSSYCANALGVESTIRTPHPTYLALAGPGSCEAAYRALISERLDVDAADEIRHATQRGMALGSDAFVGALEASTGVRLHHGSPGRPRKSAVVGTGKSENVL